MAEAWLYLVDLLDEEFVLLLGRTKTMGVPWW